MVESEQDLIQVAGHDPEAFGELYQRYVPRIYSYVYYRTGNAADAEDLTGKVFLQALIHLPRYSDRGVPFSAWLFRIAHNLVANWYRDRGRHPALPLDDLHPATAGLADAEAAEEREMVRRAVARLSPDRQHLIVLKFVEDMSNAEIGRVMGRSEGAVKALLYRTLRGMREELGAVDGVGKELGDEPKTTRRNQPVGGLGVRF